MAQRVDREFGEIVAAARAALDRGVIENQIAVLEGWNREGVAERLDEFRVPTLIAAGSDDAVIPAANSLALATGIESSWLARFRGAGHGFMAEVPGPLAALIRDFAATAPAAATSPRPVERVEREREPPGPGPAAG